MTNLRVVHNKDNPFAQVNKQSLWDENLSLKAVGLWARCISHPDNWKFNLREMIASCKEGRSAIEAALQELLDQGYAMRLEGTLREKGKFISTVTEFVFFEVKANQLDKDEQVRRFKKEYPDYEYIEHKFRERKEQPKIVQKKLPPEPVIKPAVKKVEPVVVKPPVVKPVPIKEKPTPAPMLFEKKEYSETISSVAKRIADEIERVEPEWKRKNVMPRIEQFVHFMITLDNRDPETIVAVLIWALNDDFWKPLLLVGNPAEKIRKYFLRWKNELGRKPVQKNSVDRRTLDEWGNPIQVDVRF